MKSFIYACSLLLMTCMLFASYGCSVNQKDSIYTVVKTDFTSYVIADGNLSMPKEVRLKFKTPGTVRAIYVKKGDTVKAGKLLAKLDDTLQKIAVRNAQYDVELALNQLAEKVYPSLLGYPHFYPSFTSLLRVEQAQKEVELAMSHFNQQEYYDSAVALRVADYDLRESRNLLEAALVYVKDYPEETRPYVYSNYDPLNQYSYISYPAIPNAIRQIDVVLEKINYLRDKLEKGDYPLAEVYLKELGEEMAITQSVVDKACGKVIKSGIYYPDASTSLSVMRQIWENLSKIERLMFNENADLLEIAELLRIALYDTEASRDILSDNELLFKYGINMQALRAYNLNYQKAELALLKAKKDLMDTEILAPFSGVVNDLGVKENDLLSAYDFSTKVAVHLVDTSYVEMTGLVDEVDIFKVSVGQRAKIALDALPGVELWGRVTFISPFTQQIAGIVSYPVTVTLDRTDRELKSGLTATARIIVEDKADVIVIPSSAIIRDKDKYYVNVVVDEKKMRLERREIKIGSRSGLNTEVVAGLDEGEKIELTPRK